MLLSNTMLVLAMLILGAGLAVQARDGVRRSPSLFIWGVLFLALFIVFPLILNLFFGFGVSIRGDLLTNESHYLIYGMSVIVFCLAYAFRILAGTGRWSGSRQDPPRLPVGRSGWSDAPAVEKFVFTLSGLLVPVGLAVYIKGTGLSPAELLVASRFEWYARETGSGLVLNLGMYTLGLIAVYTYYDVRFGVPRKWLSVLVYSAILLAIFLSGGRKWLLFMAAGAVAGFYDAQGGRFVPTRKMVAGLLGVTALVFLLQFGRAVSWQDESSRAGVAEAMVEAVPGLFVEGDATYFYRASLDAIRLNKDEAVTYPLAIVRRLLLLPLPEDWTFGLKPEGIPFLFSDEFDSGNRSRRGNMPPGLVGLFVLSFGWWLAPVVMAVTLIPLLDGVDRVIKTGSGPLRHAFFASFSVAAILLMRGSTGGIYFLVFNCAVTLALVVVYHVGTVFRTGITVPDRT